MQTKTITLLTGDYPDRLNALYRAANAAKDDETPLTLADIHPYDTLREEYDALKAESEAAGIVVTLGAVNRPAWRKLKAAHPQRIEGDEDAIKGDRLAGLNTDSVGDDLVHASVLEPKFTTRSAFDEWADELSEGEFQTLLRAAWSLANVAQFDPKSLPALPTRSNVANSE